MTEQILDLLRLQTCSLTALIPVQANRAFVSRIDKHIRHVAYRLPAGFELIGCRAIDEGDFTPAHGIDKDAPEFRDTALKPIGGAVLTRVLNAASRIQDNRKTTGAKKSNRPKTPLGGVRKAQQLVIEDAVQIHEKQSRRPD